MQTHLKGFGLENFRVFKDYTWFDFAPITILTGPNSSGKSSLNKALLLLKDNFEKGNLPPYYTLTHEGWSTNDELLWERDSPPSEDEGEFNQTFEPSSLELDGRIHGLNDPSKILNNTSASTYFSLTIPYDITVHRFLSDEEVISELDDISINSPDFFNSRNISEIEKSNNLSKELFKKLIANKDKILQQIKEGKIKSNPRVKSRTNYKIKYFLEFFVENNKAKSIYALKILDKDNTCILSIKDHEIYFDPKSYDQIIQSDDFNVEGIFSDSYKKTIISNHEVTLDTWFEENEMINEVENVSMQILSSLGISQKSQPFSIKSIEKILIGIDYLAPSQNKQKRVYSEDDISEFKKTMQHLYSAKSSGFQFDDFFKSCSNLFNINGFFTFEYDKEKDTFFPNINGSSLTDFGYGYNQLSSLLFKVASHGSKKYIRTNYGDYMFNDETSVLIIEEPEANLHPKFQSLLADFLVEAANTFNIQFIIETHSEYLIRKLQYLTAKKMIKPKDSIIYYFHEPNNVPVGEKQVKKIEILEDGSLSDDFGSGFFDEAANWELELLRLKNLKNRQN